MRRTLLFLAGAALGAADGFRPPACKNIPGDPGWPTPAQWDRLNRTVGGRLIATVPLASVCHLEPFGNYDAAACEALKPTWDFPQAHFNTAGEIGSGWFQNESCGPYTPASRPCVLGNYVNYAINVANAEDVKAGIRFAKLNNIRLVIKNSGHDVLGKSTGKGALMLWTFNLKSTTFIPAYSSPQYSGPAMKLGAGVMVGEAYTAADSHGYRVVGGSCPTVGLTGGYAQGGGHSALSSLYGLAADNVLAWEVVTANGDLLTATPTSNPDLYWALSGGGGGTFGVVLSMTTRLHADGPIGGATLAFDDSAVGNAAFWRAVNAFHATLPGLLGPNNTIAYGMTLNAFVTFSVTAPGSTEADVQALFAPFLADLTSRGISYFFSTRLSPTFMDHFATDFGPLPYGPFTVSQFVSSRMIPRAAVGRPVQNAAIGAALRRATLSGDYQVLCQALDVSVSASRQPVAANAVFPAWRDALSHCLLIAPWNWTAPLSEMQRRKDVLMNDITAAITAATPGSGTYLNEANFDQPNWQREFHGINYPRLLRIKARYDPNVLFYATTAVGSEAWVPDGSGRLCRP